MDRGAARGIFREIRTLYTLGTMGGRSDAELLETFLARGEVEAGDAFATLVSRHGPMVLGICRRMLPASHDAEDAFQATFLVLARRAVSIVRRERLASWLYGVAVRTAQVARRRTARQRTAERRLMDDASEVTCGPAEDREDWLPILDEELDRLPHRYRVALMACELQGKSRHDAARQLGIPEGTLSTHLARGRKLLRERLQRRGVSLEVAPIAGLAGPHAEVAVPERLIGPTVRAVLADSSAAGATAIVTTAVSSLAERVLKMMFLTRLTWVVAALTTAAAGIVTAVALGLSQTTAESPKPTSTRTSPIHVGGASNLNTDRYGDPLPDGAVARLGSIRFRGGNSPVHDMRFSADGQTLLTVSGDWLLRLWETKTGRLLHEALPGSGAAFGDIGIAFTPDGKQIALTGMERGSGAKVEKGPVRLVVDVASGKELRRLPATDSDADSALAFTPDGKSLMSLRSDGLFRVEEIASGAEVLRREFPRDAGAGPMALSPDGRLVAIWTGAITRKLYLWDWQGGAEPRALKAPLWDIDRLVFSPDGKALLACSIREPFVDEWDVATGVLKAEIALRDDIAPAGLALAPDGQTIAVTDFGSRQGKSQGGVLLLEHGTGKLVRALPTPGVPAHGVVFSPDGRWLAAAAGNGVHVWSLPSGEEIAAGSVGHQSPISQIATAPGGLIATASIDHTVRLWDAVTGAERRRLPHGDWVPAIAISPDGRFLVTSSMDDFVALWDLPGGKEVYKISGPGALGGYQAVGFTPDGRRFLSWGDDFHLRIWDVKTARVLVENVVRPPGVVVPGNADRAERNLGLIPGEAVLAPDGRRLVAELGGSLHIIETATGRIESSMKFPGDPSISIAIAPDGRTFATSECDRPIERKLPDGHFQSTTPNHHPVRLFELATGKRVRELEIPTADAGPVAFSADGKLLAIGFGLDRGEVRLVDAATLETVAELADFGSVPQTMAFSTDGKSLITGLYDGTALVWDLKRALDRKARRGER